MSGDCSPIKRTMAVIVHKQRSTNDNSNTPSRIQSTEPVIAADKIGTAWELAFQPGTTGSQVAAGQAAIQRQGLVAAAPAEGIAETAVSTDEFARLLSQATPAEGESDEDAKPVLIGGRPLGKLRAFRRIKNFVKKATSVVVGAFQGALNIIVKTAEGIFTFVLDTAQKVAEFVEAVVEKVVKGIKQFIEFLQFLFNWGDILKTQRYLVGTINGALDFATHLADDAKPRVTAFVNNLQASVEDGMNSLGGHAVGGARH